MVVVLPAPFGPRKPVTLPASTVKLRSSTARTDPNRLVRFLDSIICSPAPIAGRGPATTRPPPESTSNISLPLSRQQFCRAGFAAPGCGLADAILDAGVAARSQPDDRERPVVAFGEVSSGGDERGATQPDLNVEQAQPGAGIGFGIRGRAKWAKFFVRLGHFAGPGQESAPDARHHRPVGRPICADRAASWGQLLVPHGLRMGRKGTPAWCPLGWDREAAGDDAGQKDQPQPDVTAKKEQGGREHAHGQQHVAVKEPPVEPIHLILLRGVAAIG